MSKIVPLIAASNRRSEEGRDWFTRWMDAHRGALKSYVRRVAPAGTDVDDVVQDVFLRVWRLAEPDAVQNPRAYLMRVARNTMVDLLRKSGDAGRENAAPARDGSLSCGALDCCELMFAIERAIGELPEKRRMVFLLCRYDGLSTAEIAARMGISERMVQKHLARALSHLHRNLF